jgi:hypothetical protein
VSRWTLTALIAGVISFYASARTASRSSRSPSVAATLVTIIGGILVFHEPIGSGHAIGTRFLAFCPSCRRRSAHARPDARHPDAAEDALRRDEPVRPDVMPDSLARPGSAREATINLWSPAFGSA